MNDETQIKILPELKALIPPLTPEEFSQLEQNCINEGIRDPLVVWENLIDTIHPDFDWKCYAEFDRNDDCIDHIECGDGVWHCRKCGHGAAPWVYEYCLIDGHNRLEIAKKNNLKYSVHVIDNMELPDLDAVRQWMDENQIGRRNLHPKHFKILLGRIYNRRKKAPSGRNDRVFGGTKNVPPKTRQQLAGQYGVGEQTVINAGQQQEVLSELSQETGKSEFQLIDEIGKDKHLKKIHQRKKKQPYKPVTAIAEEVISEAKAREEKQSKKRTQVKETLKKLSLLDFVGSKKYRVVYTDPPWQYSDSKKIDGYTGTDDHYITMPIDAICKMPIRQITEANAVLFLWVTSPFLEDCFKVINGWGFKYKASFVWNKVKHNMGHYNSVRHEFLLVATRGSCTPDKNRLFNSVQEIDRTNSHSEKPEQFREIIDTLYTWGNKIEIFGRKDIDGWDVFGNQKIDTYGRISERTI